MELLTQPRYEDLVSRYGRRLPQQKPPLWHPKLTGARIFIILATLAVGGAKAYFTYHGTELISTTVECVGGVVIFNICFWLEYQKANDPRWLFETDYGDTFLSFVRVFSVTRPGHQALLSKRRSLPVATGYNLLIALSAICFGLGKSVFSYLEFKTTSGTLDWVFATLVFIGLYWMGLYESSPIGTFPSLFDYDFLDSVVWGVPIFLASLWFLLVGGAGLWTFYTFSSIMFDLWDPNKKPEPATPGGAIFGTIGCLFVLSLSLAWCVAAVVLLGKTSGLAVHVIQ